ncbi:MAG TPA: hypothetical protein VGL19_07245 [Polyangiaceae bacterium]
MKRLEVSARYGALSFGLVLAVLLSGCGVSSWVTAPDSKYPISMSSGLRDQHGELVPAASKTTVGTFEKHYKACSMLWRLISFTGDKDISDSVNEQVAANKGDAVQDLSVESSGTVWNIITFIGIFPDCANVRLKGTIVKVTPPAPPVATPAAAPAPAAVPPAAAPPPPAPAAANPSPLQNGSANPSDLSASR